MELLAAFAVFKITVTLMDYDGPLNLVRYIRNKLYKIQQDKILNFDCFFCLSTIVSLPFGFLGQNFILTWLSVAGISLIINTVYEKLNV